MRTKHIDTYQTVLTETPNKALNIVTDALLCKTIAENTLMSAHERVVWIEGGPIF